MVAAVEGRAFERIFERILGAHQPGGQAIVPGFKIELVESKWTVD
jgi:hypothetical protein